VDGAAAKKSAAFVTFLPKHHGDSAASPAKPMSSSIFPIYQSVVPSDAMAPLIAQILPRIKLGRARVTSQQARFVY
jgi:hypothetical protein